MVEAPLPQHWRWEIGWMDVNGRRWWNTLLVPFVNSLSSREVKCLIFWTGWNVEIVSMKFKSYYCITWMTNSCNARSPVILCQVVHKKFSHSQFSQFGSNKGRNDSNLFDPSGSIFLNTRDNAQALPLSLVDSIHCSNALNLHGHTETGLNLNGSNTELRYDVKLTSGSGPDKHVWPLDASRAFGMHAEGWAVHHDRNLEQSVFVKSYFEPPRSSHFDPFFAQCKNDGNKLNELWTKIVELKTQAISHLISSRKFGTYEIMGLYSHLGVGAHLVKMLTILFWLVQVLYRLIAICQSTA